jgi:lactate permease
VWIIIMAIWLYQVTVRSGRFNDLRKVFNVVGGGDVRIQGVLIAFCFGGLMEALAGFGAPVAITATMLMALGLRPLKAAAAVLVANTAPVAFGAVGTPITTAGNLLGTHDPVASADQIGAIIGHQSPILALFVPTLLVFILDGVKGLKDCWVVTVIIGVVFAVLQFLSSNFFSYELTDVVASLGALAVAILVLRFYKPKHRGEARARVVDPGSDAAKAATTTEEKLNGVDTWMALLPYVLVVIVFGVAKLWKIGVDVPTWLASTDVKIEWPGLHDSVLTAAGDPVSSTTYSLPWLSSPGSLIFITVVLVVIFYSIFNGKGRYKMNPGAAVHELGTTALNMKFAALTIVLVLALAYIMNLSGQTVAIGTWMAGAGGVFAFLSPILGWIGTAVTGSDTSANALFTNLQATAAHNLGVDPHLFAAANTSGGVVGKLISPQNLALAASTVGMEGKESVILKKVIGWSLAMLLVLCVVVFIEAQFSHV